MHARGKKLLFPILFILSVQESPTAELLLLSYHQRLSDCAHPQGCPTELHPCLGHLPPRAGPHTPPVPAPRLVRMELSLSCAQLAQELPQPQLRQIWNWFGVCPSLVPMSFLWGWPWMEPPEEPLATPSSSHLLVTPAQGLPVASSPSRSPEAKHGSSHPAMDLD